MKYRDVIQFAPIETVVQLRQAEEVDSARSLVRSLVVSQRLAEDLRINVAAHLSFRNANAKGVFVVGNYGTGKSHVMSVVAGIAEHASLVDDVQTELLDGAFGEVAGQFVVVRAEINGMMSLRDFVMGELKDHLASVGVEIAVPPEHEVRNHKDVFDGMMDRLAAVHPGKGLLFVLDELLDYLRANDNQQITASLNFLRAVGEYCAGSRFRFIAGVQESLFANPSFQFAAESLQRVQARFVQMRIVREDVSHVVAHRLLRKSPDQMGRVRHHLEKFAPLFDQMAERMDDFVRLYPVHPRYLEVFERIHVAEKREVLKTLSQAIQRLLDTDVPADSTGLIGYDSYWPELSGNPIFTVNPAIREVLDKSRVLEDKVRTSLARDRYKAAAIRVIHALSVQRLAQADLHAKIGVTATELRDGLCLQLPLPEGNATADFLRTTIETVLREIVRTVNGQFIAQNPENQQYYLDLKRDIDFETLVAQKGDTLAPSVLDRYYFDVLRRTIFEDPTVAQNPHVRDPQVWQYEVPWPARGVTRTGYLFFGAPNQRNTATPPRDAYLYFLHPFAPPAFRDDRKPDELFFRMGGMDEAFTRTLRLFAGAQEMALHAAAGSKGQYESLAAGHLRTLGQWLTAHHATAFDVTYQGTRVPRPGAPAAQVREWIDNLAAGAFGAHFQSLSPQYPTFKATITRTNRAQAAADAIRWIGGGLQNRLGLQVLEALGLIDGSTVSVDRSPYAQAVMSRLAGRGEGQVLNRADLVGEIGDIEYWREFRLEPEFLAVVLAALAYTGNAVVNAANGANLDATSGAQFNAVGLDNLVAFRHVRRPRDFPVGPLRTLFPLLGLNPATLANTGTYAAAIAALQERVHACVTAAATAAAAVGSLTLWGDAVLAAPDADAVRARIGAVQRFLQSVQPFKTVAQMTNFPHGSEAIAAQRPNLDAIAEVDRLRDFVQRRQAATHYLQNAELVLGRTHPWTADVQARRAALMARVVVPAERDAPAFAAEFDREVAALRDAYRDAYLNAHARARLGVEADRRKADLYRDRRLAQLGQVKAISLMPVQQLTDLQAQLQRLKTCFSLAPAELAAKPWCPHCTYRPAEEPPARLSATDALDGIDERLDSLVEEWTATLLRNLATPEAQAGLALLAPGEGRTAVTNFISRKVLSDPVPLQMVTAIETLLQGLERVEIAPAAIAAALASGGLPCTVAELKARFDRLLADATRGKAPARVRIVLGSGD